MFLHADDILSKPCSSFIEPERGTATWHTLLSAPDTPTTSLCAGIAVCPSNGSLALHRHTQAEIYYVLSGEGEVEVDGKWHRVTEKMSVCIPGDAEHGVFCGEGETLEWLYVFPEGNFHNVVYRFSEASEKTGRGEVVSA